jgi:membrane fusion protein, multidrug efflux system
MNERPATGRRTVVVALVALAALALVAMLARQWWFGRHHVRTDNAQVEGHVVPVLPKVGGYVTQVRVVDDTAVRAGDTLVVLDDRDFRARLAQAEGDLAKENANAGTRGTRGQAEAQLSAARASVVQAEAADERARGDLRRFRTLAERGIVSRQQLDAAETAAQVTAAQLAAARDQVVAATAALAGAGARVEAARAARDQALLQISYATVVAPGSGVVSRKNVEVGQLVQPGQALMAVVPLDDVWVVANLKETEVRDVTPGDVVDIVVDAYPGRHVRGEVESMSPATGARFSLLPPDNATGNFTKVVQRIPVRIRVTGPRDPAHLLRPGMSATVTIRTR